MKQVPFYPNHEDDMHCVMAAYSSVLDYFLNLRLSWEELEELVGYKSGKAAWTAEALPKLAKLGLGIRMIEPFDYSRYYEEGENYLSEFYSKDQLDWHTKNSNIAEMKRFIPELQKSINHEFRQATLNDIDRMLKDGRLVFVTVNSRKLNDKLGFSSHAVLVIDKNEDYVIHDPGLPPYPYRKVSSDKLWQSMGGNSNTAEVTGFKLEQAVEQKV